MKVRQLTQALKGKNPPIVVDVRTSFEFHAGHIPGALNLPVYTIAFRCGRVLPDKDAQLVLTCEHGPRAMLAKTLLGWRGYRNIDLLEGHMLDYKRQKLPLEK